MTNLTPTKRQLLRDVADGEVWQHADGQSVASIHAINLPGYGTVRRVTSRIADLEQAGLVRVVLVRGDRQWQLTDAGRAAINPCKED